MDEVSVRACSSLYCPSWSFDSVSVYKIRHINQSVRTTSHKRDTMPLPAGMFPQILKRQNV